MKIKIFLCLLFFLAGILIGITIKKTARPLFSIGNQGIDFIRPFFATVQLLLAGNDTEGLRFGTTETTEDYYLSWKSDEPGFDEENRLDRNVLQMCGKQRFLEIIHDFIAFDSGIKSAWAHKRI